MTDLTEEEMEILKFLKVDRTLGDIANRFLKGSFTNHIETWEHGFRREAYSLLFPLAVRHLITVDDKQMPFKYFLTEKGKGELEKNVLGA